MLDSMAWLSILPTLMQLTNAEPCYQIEAIVLGFFARVGGRTRDLLISIYFLLTWQRLRPLGYCSPLFEAIVCSP